MSASEQERLQEELQRRMPDKDVKVATKEDGTMVAGVRDPETGEVKTREIDREQLRRAARQRQPDSQRETGGEDVRRAQRSGGGAPADTTDESARGEQFREDVASGRSGGEIDSADTQRDGEGLSGDADATAGQSSRDGADELGDDDGQPPQRSRSRMAAGSEQAGDDGSNGSGSILGGLAGAAGGVSQTVQSGVSGTVDALGDAGQDITSGVEDITDEVEERPGGKTAGSILAVGAAPAAAEPTPAGEIALGAGVLGALGVGAAAEQTNADEEIDDLLGDFPTVGNQAQSGDGPGATQEQSGEVPVGSFIPQSELGVAAGATTATNELQPSESQENVTETEPGLPREETDELQPTAPGLGTPELSIGESVTNVNQNRTGQEQAREEATQNRNVSERATRNQNRTRTRFLTNNSFGFSRPTPRLDLFGDDTDVGRPQTPSSGFSPTFGEPDGDVAPGFVSETVRDIALLGSVPADGDGDLEDEATETDLLTGEVPTETELFGTDEQQAAIEETSEFLGFGGGDDDSGGLL